MLKVILALLRLLLSGFQSQSGLVLENVALRHQLAVLKRQAPKPRLRPADRLLWVGLLRFWPDWQQALLLVQPQTVIAWHRLGFRLFWRWKSRARGGRPSVDADLVALIRQIWQPNPTWGSLRIQAELAKLGIRIPDSTVRQYRPKRHRSASVQTWKTFLHNHAKELVATDFFTVPTATFRVLYVFLVLAHERRRVLHFNITQAPSALWTAQQVVEASPFTTPPRSLLRDRDGIYGADFVRRVEGFGLEQKLIAPRSPWQNPVVERLIGSLRRECSDHVILFNEEHLRRMLTDYLTYYHRHRTHRSLEQDCPEPRAVEPPDQGTIIELPLVCGLHHRSARQAAARARISLPWLRIAMARPGLPRMHPPIGTPTLAGARSSFDLAPNRHSVSARLADCSFDARVWARDGVFATHRCPACFRTWRKEGTELCHPLMWSLAAVRFCPIHGEALHDTCRACGKHHWPLQGRAKAGYCPHCRAWLGALMNPPDSRAGPSSPTQSPWDVFAAEESARFVGWLRSAKSQELVSHFSKNIGLLVEQPNGRSSAEREHAVSAHRRTLSEWIAGTQRPSLYSLLLLSDALRLGVHQLLFEDIRELGASLSTDLGCRLQSARSTPRTEGTIFLE